MKRKQVYRVRFTHFANYYILVEAESREKAKEMARREFTYADPAEQWEKITKVVCLGTAEKTKPRRGNPYRHGCAPQDKGE